MLKGQSNDIFDPQFFIIWTGLCHWPIGLNIFVFGFVFVEKFEFFRSSAQYHIARSQDPRSMILRGVMWLFRILFKGTTTIKRDFLPVFFNNSRLPWPLSNGLKYVRFWFCFRRDNWVFLDWLRAVWYCTESVFFILNFEYLGENETKLENILIHWWVAQAGSKDVGI